MQITEPQQKAAQKIFELIAKELSENRAVHPATAISSCARLSGSFMFRSFALQLQNVSPGNVVLSEKANEKGPVLINLLARVLSKLGLNIDEKKLHESSITASNLNFLETLDSLQNKAAGIMDQYKLSYEQMACSCAIAAAFLIKECQHDLAAEAGFNTAIYSIIEGSKTYPPELSDSTPIKKSIFRFWK